MSAVLPRPRAIAAVDPSPAATRAHPATAFPDRAVDGLVLFFDSEARAQEALCQPALRRAMQGALPALLRPDDRRWLRFLRPPSTLPGAGALPRWWRDPGLFALLGGLSGGMTASVALVLGHLGVESIVQSLALSILAGVAGAAIGAALIGVAAYLPPYSRFDRVVWERLAAGQWAVRMHAIPWASQPALFAWLRAQDVHWYATVPRLARV